MSFENPSQDEQVEKSHDRAGREDEFALRDLLEELETKPRVLTSGERVFLKGQLHRIGAELDKTEEPNEESAEYNALTSQIEKVKELLQKDNL